jgi:hypothetical protein
MFRSFEALCDTSWRNRYFTMRAFYLLRNIRTEGQDLMILGLTASLMQFADLNRKFTISERSSRRPFVTEPLSSLHGQNWTHESIFVTVCEESLAALASLCWTESRLYKSEETAPPYCHFFTSLKVCFSRNLQYGLLALMLCICAKDKGSDRWNVFKKEGLSVFNRIWLSGSFCQYFWGSTLADHFNYLKAFGCGEVIAITVIVFTSLIHRLLNDAKSIAGIHGLRLRHLLSNDVLWHDGWKAGIVECVDAAISRQRQRIRMQQ